MIPKEIIDSLSKEELSMLESLQKIGKARKITISYEDGELVFHQEGELIGRRKLSYLKQMRSAIIPEDS